MEVFGIFAIDGIELAAGGALGEEGAAEEGTEAEEGFGEAGGGAAIHFKVVDSFLG